MINDNIKIKKGTLTKNPILGNGKYINKKKLKHTKKRIIHKGGEKIGEGSFGCVIFPHIPCNNNRDTSQSTKKKYISKLIRGNDKKFTNELEMYNTIKKIDPKQKYLISYVNMCKLDTINSIKTHNDDLIAINYNDINNPSNAVDGYKLLDSTTTLTDEQKKLYCKIDPRLEYYNQIQQYGGIALTSFLKLTITDIKYKIFKANYKFICKRLLLGLKELHKAKIGHRDIKPDNILVSIINNKNAIPKYIDFGLSTDFSGEYKLSNITRKGTNKFISLDTNIIYALIKSIRENQDILSSYGYNKLKTNIIASYNEIYKSYYNDRKINKEFLSFKASSNNIYEDKTQYLTNDEINQLIYKIVKQYATNKLLANYIRDYDGYIFKSDITALGIVFKSIYDTYKINDNRFENLIKHMLQPDPDKRYNINQCLRHPGLKKIIKST